MTVLLRWLVRLVSVAVLLTVIVVLAAWWIAGRSIPDYDADWQVTGINGPIEIVRNTAAVPHIFGDTDADHAPHGTGASVGTVRRLHDPDRRLVAAARYLRPRHPVRRGPGRRHRCRPGGLFRRREWLVAAGRNRGLGPRRAGTVPLRARDFPVETRRQRGGDLHDGAATGPTPRGRGVARARLSCPART